MPPINQPVVSNSVTRPTLVEVNLSRLTANFQAIDTAVSPAKVMVVLKANAYGHGLIETARHLVSVGADYLGVAYLEEGIWLRENGIDAPILVMGGLLSDQTPLYLQHNLTVTASSVEKLEQIETAARDLGVTAKAHLKIDTGMERIGVHYYSAESLLEASLACQHCQIEGIYSHFANADAADLTSARLQLERFQEVLQFYEKRSLPTPLRHIANSGAILQLPESHLDMVRPGILLYGVYPSAEIERTIAVRPALSWKSRVVYFKVVLPGHPVSYGSTWQSDSDDAGRHRAGRVWGRLFSQYVGAGGGDCARPSLSGGRPYLHGSTDGQHRLGQRLQRRRSGSARRKRRSGHSLRGVGGMGWHHSV
jgi:alanine racemase